MRDIHFSWFMVVLAAVVSVTYVARALRLGRAHHARADADGGSVFVGKPVMEMGYWIFHPVVALLRRSGVTPNMVTGFSLLPGLAAGVAAAFGWFGLACVLATFSSLCDLVDGLLARELRCGSDAGELFDASVDRYVEAFLMCGLVVYFRTDVLMLTLTLAALFGGFMVSYTTAKAEAMTVPSPRGAMRRAERAIYINVACGSTPFFASWLLASSPNPLVRQWPICFTIAFVAVVSNVSVLQRLRAIAASLRARDRARDGQAHSEPACTETRRVDGLGAGTQNPARIA